MKISFKYRYNWSKVFKISFFTCVKPVTNAKIDLRGGLQCLLPASWQHILGKQSNVRLHGLGCVSNTGGGGGVHCKYWDTASTAEIALKYNYKISPECVEETHDKPNPSLQVVMILRTLVVRFYNTFFYRLDNRHGASNPNLYRKP